MCVFRPWASTESEFASMNASRPLSRETFVRKEPEKTRIQKKFANVGIHSFSPCICERTSGKKAFRPGILQTAILQRDLK